MASIADLASRVLRKLEILAAGQTPSAEDYQLALEKLRAAHAALRSEDIRQWTMNDIPDFAEEPYVCMAAALAGPDFGRPMPDQWNFGLLLLRQGGQLRSAGRVSAEYF